MEEMKRESPLARNRTPLVVKASLPRTFLSLGVFAEIALLFFGCYLLAQSIQQPLETGTATVLFGSLFLSLATVLLFYLVCPAKVKSLSHRDKLELDDTEDAITVNAKHVPEEPESRWLPEIPEASTNRIEAARFHAAGKAGR